jgi:hypothetical protein
MAHRGPPVDEVGLIPDLLSILGNDRSTQDWLMMLEMKDRLYENRLVGEPIRKSQIPKYYLDKY